MGSLPGIWAGLQRAGPGAGDVVDYRDLNRWEASFELMQHYESQTAETLKNTPLRAFSCGDNTAYYR